MGFRLKVQNVTLVVQEYMILPPALPKVCYHSNPVTLAKGSIFSSKSIDSCKIAKYLTKPLIHTTLKMGSCKLQPFSVSKKFKASNVSCRLSTSMGREHIVFFNRKQQRVNPDMLSAFIYQIAEAGNFIYQSISWYVIRPVVQFVAQSSSFLILHFSMVSYSCSLF